MSERYILSERYFVQSFVNVGAHKREISHRVGKMGLIPIRDVLLLRARCLSASIFGE